MIVLARSWWALALRGLAAVLFGIMAFAWPGITLASLILVYGVFALVGGIFAIAAAIAGRPQGGQPWWALLIDGLLGIAVGIVAFAWPGLTALALLYLIAFWAVFTGVLQVIAAVQLRKEIQGEWLLALGGILSVLFGVALVVRPMAGALAVIWLIGAYSIAFGVLMIVLGFRLRNWSHQMIPGIGHPVIDPSDSITKRPPNFA
ncbi:HdeD family acid-resistance protein [Singulisphaera sp. Ch08]|uniref:HdeD family acid-resistance protein n=1 Tax=Singulisphaera sp. Ch08 TaxID=3120278 RepID=A0AAU7CF66_9BACT